MPSAPNGAMVKTAPRSFASNVIMECFLVVSVFSLLRGSFAGMSGCIALEISSFLMRIAQSIVMSCRIGFRSGLSLPRTFVPF